MGRSATSLKNKAKRRTPAAYILTGALLALLCALFACAPAPTTSFPLPTPRPSATPVPASASPEEVVTARAMEVILALRNRDMQLLSTFVHPTKGVRFSPYAFVQQSHLVFTPDQVKNLAQDPGVYTWGTYSGSGFPIQTTFADYYAQFVYSRDFANAEEIGYNRIIGKGNSINNCFHFYPGASVVEYHFSGFDPNMQGMDWESLRLVFQEEDGTWFLVGIIHDAWTP